MPGNDGIWPVALEQTPSAQSALLCFEAETGFVDNAADGDADPVRIAEPTG
mgnify:CR=1 FL=1